jgi:hypothetical protein
MTARSDRAVNVYASAERTSRLLAMPRASGATDAETHGLAERGAEGFHGRHTRRAFPRFKRQLPGSGRLDGQPRQPHPSGQTVGNRGFRPDRAHQGFSDGKS